MTDRQPDDHKLVCIECINAAGLGILDGEEGYTKTLSGWDEHWTGTYQYLSPYAEAGCIACGNTDDDRGMVGICNLEIDSGK